ncbi:hypothetical protein D187_002211 [Cystobacter fuscus DSM 2262]|uniref:Uncharacterized protein n=1 Tax=Cystobacter fuscus (strain ATCC 25194 / DSM 2262 / NBRC 100088 / M29) TaxID=1242864 RepID=S9P6S8_CYSF2|nr:hypothetical protein D187_002211 [Cystobacter fuscus DSM 2262]
MTSSSQGRIRRVFPPPSSSSEHGSAGLPRNPLRGGARAAAPRLASRGHFRARGCPPVIQTGRPQSCRCPAMRNPPLVALGDNGHLDWQWPTASISPWSCGAPSRRSRPRSSSRFIGAWMASPSWPRWLLRSTRSG